MTDESIVHDAEWSLIEDTEVRGEGNEAVINLAKQVLNGEYTPFSIRFYSKNSANG